MTEDKNNFHKEAIDIGKENQSNSKIKTINESKDNSRNNLLNELLDYTLHLDKIHGKTVFRIDDYNQYKVFEHELKGKIGVQHNAIDEDGASVWLQIDRLKRKEPPLLSNDINQWVSLSNDPENPPQLREEIIKTLSEDETEMFLEKGLIDKKDISEPLKDENVYLKQKDVIFRLKNDSKAKAEIESYIKNDWYNWSETEKPRRETIKIYDSLFSLQQVIEAQGDEQPIELIWGIGISRWNCKGHLIDLPVLEMAVEIEISSNDGCLKIRPVIKSEPSLVTEAYFRLEIPGLDILIRSAKKHFSELSEYVEISPYINESYEPILRQAATHLSESGKYWPDENTNKENRKPNPIGETLEISDSWVLFARPRSSAGLIQDLERFKEELENIDGDDLPNPTKSLVTELSNKKIKPKATNFFGESQQGVREKTNKQQPELFFPKPFNDAQIKIIENLEKNDGVVVQGPPGTGKTHTIANIICHYLATGRSVLVTSKGEQALSVLQEQIPKELRKLTISLLTNERKGMKQLESAIETLAALVSQNNSNELKRQANLNEEIVKQLKSEIRSIDFEIREWGEKQLSKIEENISGLDKKITAMELAQMVSKSANSHEWFPDKLGSSDTFKPQFSDSDIANLREIRRKLGDDIKYADKNLPTVEDLIDSANIASIHKDLKNSKEIEQNSKNKQIPPLAISVENSIQRAENLIKPLNELNDILQTNNENEWLSYIFNSWFIDGKSENHLIFVELWSEFKNIIEIRKQFIRTKIDLKEPKEHKEVIAKSLHKLKNGKKGFLIPFVKKEAKEILTQCKINDETPKNPEEWSKVDSYIIYQERVKKFIQKWNHLAPELYLAELVYVYGDSFQDLQWVHDKIRLSEDFTKNQWKNLASEISILFPHGIKINNLLNDINEVNLVLEAIETHSSQNKFSASRYRLDDLLKKINQCEGEINQEIKDFVKAEIGKLENSDDFIISKWQEITAELNRINNLESSLNILCNICDKIENSGAKNWSKLLRETPLIEGEDHLTPSDWYETWQWKRQEQYLHEIDDRKAVSKLSEKRVLLDNDLKRTFTELVRIKTNIGLHQNMTERIQGALMRFMSSIAKIPKTTTAKRAPRYRRQAYNAMQDCYSGVPCWIMPTWRISENLPSSFGSFDLVIIDEASQSDISALPAILRAKKILIVGDDKQVSPTAGFFEEDKILQLKHNFLSNQPFSDLLLPGVSIYDLANTIFPSNRIMLTEHFRCVEAIIRFSMQFYTEPLIPLRIPKTSEKLTPPLIDVYVKNGQRIYRKLINEEEAEAIVNEIKIISKDSKFIKRSIGIISLIGNHQASYIQKLLLSELGEEIFERHDISCGDAATFQGKEKDIMFISMIDSFDYTVNKVTGKPATEIDAERRYNVALSRARDRMYLFRSIEEKDLNNENDLRLRTIRHFSNPMPQQKQVENEIDLCESEFERDFYSKLIEIGYNVTPQVKVGWQNFRIDLVIEGENDKRLAIELDGDKYHQPEDWMNDWTRQRTMERVGWKFWRCFGSSYTIDPEGCIDELVGVLNKMEIHPYQNENKSNIYTEHRVIETRPKLEIEEQENKDDFDGENNENFR